MKQRMPVKTVKEHESIGSDFSRYDEKLKNGLCVNPEALPYNRKYFLQWSPTDITQGYTASYIIGVQWVETSLCGKFPLIILPKMDNIDYMEMFMQCFSNPDEYKSFHRIYGIDFDADPIECDTLDSILSPLLVVQYIHIVERLLHRDLKKNYVHKSDNLYKVRGRIAISQNLKTNVIHGSQHKIFCNYQEYTCDTIENRIIKKAIIISQNIINKLDSQAIPKLNTIINSCLSKMSMVSEDVSLYELKSVRNNALYKGYKEAITLAKYILKRYDKSLSDESQNFGKIPPFWIDMPLLFEHYIGGILAKSYPGDDIIYQAKGNTGYPDFLSRKTPAILDTKYKPQLAYDNPDTDDIRQLAGYSRDCDILEQLGVDYNTIVPCAFIYPDENARENGTIVFSRPLTEILTQKRTHSKKVSGIIDFYCIGIGIPKLST